MIGNPVATNDGVDVGAAHPPGTEKTAAESSWDQPRLTLTDVEPDDPKPPEIELPISSESTTPAGPTITVVDWLTELGPEPPDIALANGKPSTFAEKLLNPPTGSGPPPVDGPLTLPATETITAVSNREKSVTSTSPPDEA